jgi:hypothetical protein
MLAERGVQGEARYIHQGRHPGIIEIGGQVVETTDWMIGVLKFLSGERRFKVGDVPVAIPSHIHGYVVVGKEGIPYNDFVGYVQDTLCVREETGLAYRYPAVEVNEWDAAIRAIKRHLDTRAPVNYGWGIPFDNPAGKALANKLTVLHRDPGGISGLRRTRSEDW